jgi:hypothetical protein
LQKSIPSHPMKFWFKGTLPPPKIFSEKNF